MKATVNRRLVLSQRLYGCLLLAYPSEFRQEYGPQMAQAFRDRCREEAKRRDQGRGLVRLWTDTLLDLLRTAPREHLENNRKGAPVMKALRTIALAIIAYALLFVLTGMFLHSNRERLPFLVGTFIDSLVAIGILFNFFFLVLATTGLLPAVRAVIVSGAITAVLVLVLVLLSSRAAPDGGPNGTAIIAMVASYLIWFGVHWMWAQKKNQAQAVA